MVCSVFTICVPNVTASAQAFGAKWFIGVSGLAHANFCHTCCARAQLILIATMPYTLTVAILVVFWFDDNFFGMFHTN
jgi:hypothetical protein